MTMRTCQFGSALALALALALGSGCGGKVLVDAFDSASGGGGSATSSTSTSGSAQADCASLGQALNQAIEAARACNPVLSSVQCDGSTRVRNTCDCELVVNEKASALASTASAAHAAWQAAGCPPDLCDFCPPTGYLGCDPLTSMCASAQFD